MKKKVRYLVDQHTNHGRVKIGDEKLVDAEVAELEVKRGLAEHVKGRPAKVKERIDPKFDKETHEALMMPVLDKKDSTTKEPEPDGFPDGPPPETKPSKVPSTKVKSKPASRRKKRRKYKSNKE